MWGCFYFCRRDTIETMEYLDVLDKKGIPTGEKRLRPEIHRNGDWHRAVHVWIINGRGEVLIQKRSATIDLFKNLRDISLAGHVRSGETSAGAVRRELKEELGIVAADDDLKFVGTVESELKDGENYDKQFSDIYFLRTNINANEMKKQKEEVSEIEFISPAELEKLLSEKPEQFVPRGEEYEVLFRFLK